MENNYDPPFQKKPFYKRPRFYGITALSTAFGILLLLIFSILVLRWVNPSFTSFTLQEDWDELGMDRYSLTEYWVPHNEIPEHMKWAVIASEDQLFREHWGFDLESIQEAWDERQQGERTRGASTISQQVSKNLFLTPAESFLRKGIEAGITVFIELFWPKERIMEVYLNIAEFGPGIFGIGKATKRFYEIPASSLNPEMSSRLAAVLPSPKRMRVNPPSPYAEERSNWILRQMTQLSGIAYYQPEVIDEPADSTVQHTEPDSLISLSDVDYHFSKLDSLIRYDNSNAHPARDSARTEIIEDSLQIQE